MSRGAGSESTGRTIRILCGVALLLLVTRVVLGSFIGVAMYADSVRYLKPEDPTSVFGLDGGRGPGFLLQSIYLLPSGLALPIHVTVVGVAWACVSLIAAALTCRTWAQILVFSCVQVWSFMPFVQVWDTALMTEGLTIASVAAMIASLFFLPVSALPQRVVRWSYALALAWAFVALATRPQLVIFVLPVLLAHAALSFWLKDETLISRASGWGIGAAVGMATVALVLTLESSERYDGWYAQNRLAFRADADYLALAREQGMPECPGLLDALGDARAVRALDCPELQAWFEAGGLSPQRELLLAPTETVAAYGVDFPRQWSIVVITRKDGGPSVLDDRTPKAAVTLMNAVLRWTTIISSVAAAIAAILCFAHGRSRRSAQPLAVAVVLWTAGMAYLYASWAQDGMEITRHAIPVTLIAAPTAWMIVLLSTNERVRSVSEESGG